MPYVNVSLHTLRKDTAEHVPNVCVRLFDSFGSALVTQYNSGSSGIVSALLPTELAPYSARMFRIGWSWGPPVRLGIEEDSEWNLYGEELHHPVSSDPRVCVAYGYFRDATNQPHKGCDMHFSPVFDPLLVDGNAVLKERTIVRTDKDGYAEVPLLQGAQYDMILEGIEDTVRRISIPFSINCNLPELIFAYVNRIDISPSPVVLAVGSTVDVDVKVWTSGGVQLQGTAMRDVRWRIAQNMPPVVGMAIDRCKIMLKGLSVGRASLVPSRVDNSIIAIPSTPLEQYSADIIVE